MEIIYVLLPVSVCFGIVGLIAYLWAVRHGQFDDLDTPAMRAVFDDPKIKDQEKITKDDPS